MAGMACFLRQKKGRKAPFRYRFAFGRPQTIVRVRVVMLAIVRRMCCVIKPNPGFFTAPQALAKRRIIDMEIQWGT
jgi:hypothetical protein